MAVALRQSCSSCTRYLSPSTTKRSVQDTTTKVSAAVTPPPSPHRPRTIMTPHLSNRSSSLGAISKHESYASQVQYMQIRSAESVRHSSTYKKPVIDIPAFIQLLSVLNIDLPRYFPNVFTSKYSAAGTFTKSPNKVSAQVTSHERSPKSKDDSIENLRKAESDISSAIIQSPQNHGMKTVESETSSLAQAMDVSNHGIIANYFSSITVPGMKGKSKSKSEVDSNIMVKDDTKSKSDSAPKETGKSNLVRQLSNYIPLMASGSQKKSAATAHASEVKKKALVRQGTIAQSALDRKTRGLVKALRSATRTTSQLVRLEELCGHLAQYPDTKNIAVKEGAIPCLLKLRQDPDNLLQERAREGLSLVGYVPPVLGRGIRILTLDGGGTRGLVSIELLKRLEEASGQKIYEMFDYVCGVSTGSLIAALVAVHKIPLDRVEKIYKEFSTEVFDRNKIYGVGKLVMSHAYYDTSIWEKVLKLNIGETSFLETAMDAACPRISAISSLMNVNKLENFLFRNYNLPPGVQSHYLGSCQFKLWEGIRASSAAPGYFEESKLGNYIHQDGGVLANNPTAIAIHECRLLWPHDSLQCVVSVGTGKYEASEIPEANYSSLKVKVEKIVDSATDTEAVHITLHDLLPPSTYFRFNPYMSEEFTLDETRTEKWDVMKQDTNMYCRKDDYKMTKAAEVLSLEKRAHQKVGDWFKLQRDTHQNVFKKNE